MFDKTHLSDVQNYLLSVIPSFIHLFIQAVIYLSLFIYLFVCLFIYLSIHLFHACLYNFNKWTHRQATAIIIINYLAIWTMEMIYHLLLISSRQEITIKFSTRYEQARW